MPVLSPASAHRNTQSHAPVRPAPFPGSTRGKDPTKPHPSLPSVARQLTPASEHAQLGWIRDRSPALRPARRNLSGLAIGLAVSIQSLPTGARVHIKTLAARFPEGPTRIAGALRELETHGYLRRTRERTPGGRIVTRTISCNQPGHDGTAAGTPRNPAVRPTSPDKLPPRRILSPTPVPRTWKTSSRASRATPTSR